jgi:rhodanese-related sulfurtransferase
MRATTMTAVLLAVLAACAPSAGAQAAAGAGELVGPRDLYALLAAGAVLVVDVRTPEEFARGRVAGAINVPEHAAAAWAAELRRRAGGRPIVLYCRSGRRARLVEAVLERHGLREILHLDGQMAGWAAAGLPVERGARRSGQ